MPVTEYTWDPTTDSVLEETDGAGHVRVSYTNEPSQYGPLLSQHRDGESRYFHFDALGSTRQLTDDDENVTDTFTYDAWGNEVARTGATPSPYIWAGRWGYHHDATTGGYYIRRRIYAPSTSLWMSADPLESILFQSYLYADLSPSFRGDPSGLLSLTIRPDSLRGQRWEDAPTLNVRARLFYNTPDEPEDQITCRCISCPGNPGLKSLKCTMTLDTVIKIRVASISYPRGSNLWKFSMRWRYGHEQAHAAWLYRRFRDLATEVANLEQQFRCADDCDPHIIDLIVAEWTTARQYSADHKHQPWNGDDVRVQQIYCIPIGGDMPDVGMYTGSHHVGDPFQVEE